LFEEKDLEKAIIDKQLDLDLALIAADKVSDFLDSSLKEPIERYMVARLVSILYEETLDCSLEPEFEAKIRDLARQRSKQSVAE
jgi:hypothetical protein